MNLISLNFWDFSGSTPSPPTTDRPVVAPDTPLEPGAAEDNAIVAEPSRDEVIDPARGDQEGESREEEKTHRNRIECDHNNNNTGDVSMFATLTELLLNPFLDGYCKTPFCSDSDYLPPNCPSGGFYTAPHVGGVYQIKTQQDYLSDDRGGVVCRSNSPASSVQSSKARRRRQRPLAFAVGHGDEWKDNEGRRVVITKSRPPNTPPRQSPYRYRPALATTTTTTLCTCADAPPPQSTNSLLTEEPQTAQSNTSDNTANVGGGTTLPNPRRAGMVCQHCSRRQELDESSVTIGSHNVDATTPVR